MDTAALAQFRDAAHLGSFAAAARRRGVDPSSVSRAVAQLEASLGARLFNRSARRLTLTEAGARYLARAAPALDELDRAADEARAGRAEPEGVLRLTCSTAFGLVRIAPLLAAFRNAHPKLGLDLRLSDTPLDLAGEGIDLAIRLAPDISGDVVRAKLLDTRYRVVASQDCLAAAPLAAPDALAERDCLLLDQPGYDSLWRFRDRDGAVSETSIAGALRLSSVLMVREAARDGLGPALLADWLIAEDLADGRLVDVFPDLDAAAASFDTAAWFVYPNRAFLPAKVRAAITFFRAALR